MADGKTHYKYYKNGWGIALLVAIPLFVIIWLRVNFLNGFMFFAFFIINYFLCRWIDPDLDLIGVTGQEGRMLRETKRLSCFIGFFGALWVSYWFMYAWFIGLLGGHRSKASHGIIIGTIVRMIYFNFLILLLVFGIGLFGSKVWGWENISYNLYLDIWLFPYLISQFISWNIADSIHIYLDK